MTATFDVSVAVVFLRPGRNTKATMIGHGSKSEGELEGMNKKFGKSVCCTNTLPTQQLGNIMENKFGKSVCCTNTLPTQQLGNIMENTLSDSRCFTARQQYLLSHGNNTCFYIPFVTCHLDLWLPSIFQACMYVMAVCM